MDVDVDMNGRISLDCGDRIQSSYFSSTVLLDSWEGFLPFLFPFPFPSLDLPLKLK